MQYDGCHCYPHRTHQIFLSECNRNEKINKNTEEKKNALQLYHSRSCVCVYVYEVWHCCVPFVALLLFVFSTLRFASSILPQHNERQRVCAVARSPLHRLCRCAASIPAYQPMKAKYNKNKNPEFSSTLDSIAIGSMVCCARHNRSI